MNTVHLCTCNYCETILEDTNPNGNAPFYQIEGISPFQSLITMEDTGEDDLMRACPICKTDGYLNDDVDESKLPLNVKLVTNINPIS